MKNNKVPPNRILTIAFVISICTFTHQIFAQTAQTKETELKNDTNPENKKPTTTNSFLDGWSFDYLSDPNVPAISIKKQTSKDWEIDGAYISMGSISAEIDAQASYTYHPKLHANAKISISAEGSRQPPVDVPANERWLAANPGAIHPPARGIVPYQIALDGALESAPEKRDNGDSIRWTRTATRFGLSGWSRVPYTEIPGAELGKFFKSLTPSAGLYIAGSGSYVDAAKESTEQKNGGRFTLSALYNLPFALQSELSFKFEHSLGSSLKEDQNFCSVQLSRSIRDIPGLWDFLQGWIGKDSGTRIYIRYTDGAQAPQFKASHGFEFGIGNKRW